MSGPIEGPLVNPRIRIPGGNQDMPPIGIGKGPGSTNLDPLSIKLAILQAIRLGYRHIQIISSCLEQQTATKEAIVEALERGLVSSRDELFISCKIQYHNAGDHDLIQDLKKFLENMQLEYVNLCLVQWHDSDELKQVDDWAAMEDGQRLGLTKSIGVCDFSREMLETILKYAVIPPSVNQVDMKKLLREKELREFSSANEIAIIASFTIGEGKDLDLTQFMELEGLKIKDGQKTVDQVVVRWAYEQGIALLLESFSTEHMQEILDILEWNSSQDD